MLVTYNSILIITALSPNLNATAPKNPGWKLEQRYSICADTVLKSNENFELVDSETFSFGRVKPPKKCNLGRI